MNIDILRRWLSRQPEGRDPGLLLAAVGAILLICAPFLPGLARLVVLPALLLAPGYALLRLLGRATGIRCISIAVPASLVLTVCASLVLDVSGIRLDRASLGTLLGAVTAVFLVWSYGRQLLTGSLPLQRATPPDDHGLARPDATVGEAEVTRSP